MFFKKIIYYLCLVDMVLGIWDIQMMKGPSVYTHSFNIYCGAKCAKKNLHPTKHVPPGDRSRRSPLVGSDQGGPKRRHELLKEELKFAYQQATKQMGK